jgi:type VI secretion system protein ImpK
MPSDNPFAEPNDSDRTVFIPAPGGRRSAPAPQAAPPPPPSPPTASIADGPDRILTGSNPLLAAAASLLALLARLRNTARLLFEMAQFGHGAFAQIACVGRATAAW